MERYVYGLAMMRDGIFFAGGDGYMITLSELDDHIYVFDMNAYNVREPDNEWRIVVCVESGLMAIIYVDEKENVVSSKMDIKEFDSLPTVDLGKPHCIPKSIANKVGYYDISTPDDENVVIGVSYTKNM
jgi:hypothetical protein